MPTTPLKKYLKIHIHNLIILFILIAVTFGNSLSNAFLSDDLAEIVNNPNIGNLSYAITSHPFGFIRLMFYWLAFQLGDLNPILFRLINIFFHTGSVLLIYVLFSTIFSKRLALFASAIFAIHPAISEAVVWISGGGYPQYTFFFLLSLLLYIFSSKRLFFYFLSSIFYILSFMSHPQMPLALILIFPFWEFAFGNLKRNWVKSVPFFLIAIVFVFNTLNSLPERETTLSSVHYQERGIDNPLILIPIAISSYFELIMFPKTLTLYHSELAFGPVQFAVRSLITLLFLTSLLITFKKNKFLFFWLSFFLIALSPTLTPFKLNWIVAERYLYLPSLGIFAGVAFLLDKLAQKRQHKYIIYALFTLTIILLSSRTIMRNIDWKNEDNLWIATGKTSPSSPNTHNNLGDVYGRLGDKQTALREFQKAIELKPNYGDAYHNLGNTYRELGQADKALENYQKALEFNPKLWQSYQNIASLYFQSKQFDKALDFIQKGVLINPKNINLRVNLGIVYLAIGEKKKAKEIFDLVLSVDPQNQFAKQGIMESNK